MATPDGGSAFPAFEHFFADRADSKGPVKVVTGQPHGGMSLRDYFAGQALVGWVMRGAVHDIMQRHCVEVPAALALLAEGCYQSADAMLAAREK
jgi:hypothetical protein